MRKILALVAAAALPLAAGCAVHQDVAPSPSGPAETGISLKLASSSSLVPQDGLHPANLSVSAFDAAGHAIAVQVHFSMNPAGFGTLSTDGNGNAVTTTDASHPTVVAFLPPATTTGASTTVTIFASLVTPNLVTAQQQQIQVLTQPAASLPSTSPTAAMTLSPSATVYATNTTITFDGSTSCAAGPAGAACPGTGSITKYTWDFGDGTPNVTGSSVSHAYSSAGTYQAKLTIVTATNAMATTTQTVIVQAVAAPTAAFTFSPTAPSVGASVNFSAVTSSAAAGHTLVNYAWNFGDGSAASGQTPAHVYGAKGTYVVSLTVTDDVGQTKTTTSNVTVN